MDLRRRRRARLRVLQGGILFVVVVFVIVNLLVDLGYSLIDPSIRVG